MIKCSSKSSKWSLISEIEIVAGSGSLKSRVLLSRSVVKGYLLDNVINVIVFDVGGFDGVK